MELMQERGFPIPTYQFNVYRCAQLTEADFKSIESLTRIVEQRRPTDPLTNQSLLG